MQITANEKNWVDLAGIFPYLSDRSPLRRKCPSFMGGTVFHAVSSASDLFRLDLARWRCQAPVEPSYPSEAKREHLVGKVSVRVLINSSGEVEQDAGDGIAPRGAAEVCCASVGILQTTSVERKETAIYRRTKACVQFCPRWAIGFPRKSIDRHRTGIN